MGRIERIRQNIVGRIIANDRWWEGNILQGDLTESMKQDLIERHLFRQTVGRRRQIVAQLLDLSVRDLVE
ncbi:hypothetical protein HQ520_08430 [bacterium]|nr:hypothetical protein [bacterium]